MQTSRLAPDKGRCGRASRRKSWKPPSPVAPAVFMLCVPGPRGGGNNHHSPGVYAHKFQSAGWRVEGINDPHDPMRLG